jgi:hypothetical protein
MQLIACQSKRPCLNAVDASPNDIYFARNLFTQPGTWESMQDSPIHVLFSPLVVFRSTPFGVDAWRSAGEAAGYTGRFHGLGQPLPLYTSSSELATLRELELHASSPLEPSREILRRVTAIALAAGSRLLAADHRDTLAATGSASSRSMTDPTTKPVTPLPSMRRVFLAWWESPPSPMQSESSGPSPSCPPRSRRPLPWSTTGRARSIC